MVEERAAEAVVGCPTRDGVVAQENFEVRGACAEHEGEVIERPRVVDVVEDGLPVTALSVVGIEASRPVTRYVAELNLLTLLVVVDEEAARLRQVDTLEDEL